jgi:hypothetical protein
MRSGRPYLACVTHIELLKELRKHGAILGMDTKWDFLWFHLPAIIATFADAAGAGQLAFLALASAEDHVIVQLLIELLLDNVPCSDPGCKHESELHVFKDGSGWYVCRGNVHVSSIVVQVPHSEVCYQEPADSAHHP